VTANSTGLNGSGPGLPISKSVKHRISEASGRALRLLAVLREVAFVSYNSDGIQVLLLRANNLFFRAKIF
jgi:hypothetical protein